MTVNSSLGKATYQGNGSTTTFSFPFSTPDAESIHVFIVDATGNVSELSLGSYTIVLNPLIGANPTPAGGIVTYPVVGPPLAVGFQLVIVRQLDAVQPVSLSNQSIIYPPVIEKEFDYLTMLDQGGSEDFSRAFRVGISDPIPALVPSVGIRANHHAFFNTAGDLVPGEVPTGGVFISAAMIPVVEAPTLSAARIAMGIRTSKTISTTYGVTTDDNGIIFNLVGNAFYTFNYGPATGFPSDFFNMITNNDTRGKLIVISGATSFILWPTQSIIVSPNTAGTAWVFTRPGRWRGSATFNIDFTNGDDASDGLGTLTQAFKTIQKGIDVLENDVDGSFGLQLADGTHQVGTGIVCSKPVLGADGYKINGHVGHAQDIIVQASSGGTVFWAKDNAVLTLSGISMTVPNGNCLLATNGAIVSFEDVRFGSAAGGYHMRCNSNATIRTGKYSVYGPATFHIWLQSSGLVQYVPSSVTFETPIAVSVFIVCGYSSTLYTDGIPPNFLFPANVTGQQYNVVFNGVVYMSGATVPGTIAGTVNTGGQVA